MSKIVHPEFRDELRYTNYPFSDSATLVNNQGVFIPNNLIEDMIIYLVDPEPPVFLSRMIIEQEKLEIWFGDQKDAYQVVGVVDYTQPKDEIQLLRDELHSGLLVGRSDIWELMRGWEGEVIFYPDQTELVPKVVLPLTQIGVRTISNGTEVHSGDVWLIGAEGVQLVYNQVSVGGKNYDGVEVNVVGDPLFKQSVCSPNAYNPRNFIKEVEFTDGLNSFTCYPDEYGNLTITVVDYHTPGTITRIKGGSSGITFLVSGDQLING